MSNFEVWGTWGAPVQARTLPLTSSEAPHDLQEIASMDVVPATFQCASKVICTSSLKFLDICSPSPPPQVEMVTLSGIIILSKLVVLSSTIDIWSR